MMILNQGGVQIKTVEIAGSRINGKIDFGLKKVECNARFAQLKAYMRITAKLIKNKNERIAFAI